MSQKVIAIVDSATGCIRQVTRCPESDAAMQHQAWPGCMSVDVTESNPDTNPNDHAVDLQTMQIVARTEVNDGDRDMKRHELIAAAAAAVTMPTDLTSLMLRAASGDAAAQAEALALATERDAAQQKLAGLLTSLDTVTGLAEVQNTSWDGAPA